MIDSLVGTLQGACCARGVPVRGLAGRGIHSLGPVGVPKGIYPSPARPRTRARRPPSPSAGAPQKRRAVKVAPDTKILEDEPGAASAPAGGGAGGSGGGLSTYRELCGLATELGQPELVMRFMELANAQAALNGSRGAAFG